MSGGTHGHGQSPSTEIAPAGKVAPVSFVPVRLREDDVGQASHRVQISRKASSRPRLPEFAAHHQGPGVSCADESALQDGEGALEVQTKLANERVVIIRAPIDRLSLTTVLASLEALEC